MIAQQSMFRATLAGLALTAWFVTSSVDTGSATSGGAAFDAGEVTVVDADQRSEAKVEGASATVFALRLPDGASCPGDSAHDQWRVQSFLVPAADEPGELLYDVIGPEGTGRYALYDVDTRPYVNGLTAQNAGPGQPGLIVGLPSFSFAVFPSGTLPAGRYRMGIACTYFRETAMYWDTEVMLAVDPGDEPGKLRWQLVGVARAASDDPGSTIAWRPIGVVALLLSIVTICAVFVRGRRAQRSTTAPALEDHR